MRNLAAQSRTTLKTVGMRRGRTAQESASGLTTPAELLRAYNAMDSSRKMRALKIVEEPCPEQDAEQIELEAV